MFFFYIYISVIPRQIVPTIMLAEQNSFIPQWAIAVVVIGLASLMFVIVFGVAVVRHQYLAHTYKFLIKYVSTVGKSTKEIEEEGPSTVNR